MTAMQTMTRLKMTLASVIFQHRLLNRWAHQLLPKKRMSAGVLLFDDSDRLLIVKPSYRPDWLVPGGGIDAQESPWTGARREVEEETTLKIGPLRLIGIDWRPSDRFYDESLHYLFDGGRLSAQQQASVQGDGIEITDHKFAERDEAEALLDPLLKKRILPVWGPSHDHPLCMTAGVPDPDIR